MTEGSGAPALPEQPRQEPARSLWRRIGGRHPWRRGAVLILTALVVEYLVLPQLAGVGSSLRLLGRVNVGFVVLAVALEVASLASYAELTRAVLPRGVSGFSRLWRVDLSTLAVSHVLPGGTAGGSGLGFRLLVNEGATPSDAALALGIQGAGSALVLNAILWLALIVSIPLTGFNPLYASAALVGVVLLGGFVATVSFLTKGEDRAAAVVRLVVEHAPLLHKAAVEAADRAVHQLAARLRVMAKDRPLLRRAVGWAAANWLLDAASLFVFLAAFGHLENPDGLLVAYGLAYVLAAIPLTPGGLGVVEGVLVPSLVGFGASRAVAIVAVISYRLVNFWLPIPAGAGSYLSLQARGTARGDRRLEGLKRAVEQARQQAAPVAEDG